MPILGVKVDPSSIGLGVVFTAFVTLAGHLIKRSTTIDTSKIDDRGRLTKDLMTQVETSYTKLGELEKAIQVMQRREITFIRLFANMGAELRILNATLGIHLLELQAENLDREELQKQTREITEAIKSLTNNLDRENQYLAQIAREEAQENEKRREEAHAAKGQKDA